jgi:hypothetical protein
MKLPFQSTIMFIAISIMFGCDGGRSSIDKTDPSTFPPPYDKIKIGMTREQLINQLGIPNISDESGKDSPIGYSTGGPSDPVYKIWLENNQITQVMRGDGYTSPK